MPYVSPTFPVTVLYFGPLREAANRSEEVRDVPQGTTLAQLFAQCAETSPKLDAYRDSLVASRNQELASWNTPVCAGDEVAFLPPVSGG